MAGFNMCSQGSIQSLFFFLLTLSCCHCAWVEESRSKEGARIVQEIRKEFPSRVEKYCFQPRVFFQVRAKASWPGIAQYQGKLGEFLEDELRKKTAGGKPCRSVSHFLLIQWDLDTIRKMEDSRKFLLDLKLLRAELWNSDHLRSKYEEIEADFQALQAGSKKIVEVTREYGLSGAKFLDYSLVQDYANLSEHAQSLIHRGSNEFLDQLFSQFALHLNLRVTTNGVFTYEINEETGLYKELRAQTNPAVKYTTDFPAKLAFHIAQRSDQGNKVQKIYMAILRKESGNSLRILESSEFTHVGHSFDLKLRDPGRQERESEYTLLFSAAPLDFLAYENLSARRAKFQAERKKNQHLGGLVKSLIDKENWSFENLVRGVLRRPLHYFVLSQEEYKGSRGSRGALERLLLDRDINGVGLVSTSFKVTVYK